MTPLDRVRRFCLDHPDVEERLSHGECCWFVGGKRLFVMFADHHHDERVALWAAAPEGAHGRMVADEPDAFFVPPYYGVRGWVGVWLDRENVDWDRVELVVAEAWRTVSAGRPARRAR